MSNSKRIPHLQMITSQLKENIIQGWVLYVIKPFLKVGFSFQYQLIILVWLYFDFFSIVCIVVQKYHEMSFIYNASHV